MTAVSTARSCSVAALIKASSLAMTSIAKPPWERTGGTGANWLWADQGNSMTTNNKSKNKNTRGRDTVR